MLAWLECLLPRQRLAFFANAAPPDCTMPPRRVATALDAPLVGPKRGDCQIARPTARSVGQGRLVSFYARSRDAAPRLPISLNLGGQSIMFEQTWPAARLLMVALALAAAGYASRLSSAAPGELAWRVQINPSKN